MSKKGAKTQQVEATYDERDIVLAKVRGYPPWPGMVVDPGSAPSGVVKERPSGKKTSFYCVRFFPAGDYAWLVSKDISKLQPHEIQAYINEPHKRSGDLLSGYKIAMNPEPWEKERANAAMVADEQEGNAEVDQLDSEGEEEDQKKPAKSKKRKRDSEAPAPKAKAKAKPKGEKKAAAPKAKKNGIKSKAQVESEDEGDDGEQEAEAEDEEDVGPSTKSAPPPSKKPKREKEDDVDPALEKDPEAQKVREWRHRLQKALLGSKGLPAEDEMPHLDALFTTVEQYDHANIIAYLLFSKIGKVMRHIAALSPDKVPRDDEFQFRTRAKSLVDKWHTIIGSNKNENGVEMNGLAADKAQSAEAEPQSEVKSQHMESPKENGATA
ncbi:hypothetical protein BJ138DRAFT_969298, partial [Hygrophoropsis aurantiaca]